MMVSSPVACLLFSSVLLLTLHSSSSAPHQPLPQDGQQTGLHSLQDQHLPEEENNFDVGIIRTKRSTNPENLKMKMNYYIIGFVVGILLKVIIGMIVIIYYKYCKRKNRQQQTTGGETSGEKI